MLPSRSTLPVSWTCLLLLLATVLSTFQVHAFKGMPVTFHEYQYTGEGNNPENPTFGVASAPRIRNMPPGNGAFADLQGTPRSDGLPSARRIMEELFRKPVNTQTKALRCELLLYFGLLVSVDTMKMGFNESEPFHVPCDGQLNDAVFCPATGNTYCASTTPEAYNDTTAPPPPPPHVACVLCDLGRFANAEDTGNVGRWWWR